MGGCGTVGEWKAGAEVSRGTQEEEEEEEESEKEGKRGEKVR